MADNKRKTGLRAGTPKTRARSSRSVGEPAAALAVATKATMDGQAKESERRSPPRGRASEPAKASAKHARTPAQRSTTRPSGAAKATPTAKSSKAQAAAKHQAATKARGKTASAKKGSSRKPVEATQERIARKPRAAAIKAPAASKLAKTKKQAVGAGTHKTAAKAPAKGRPNARRQPIQVAKFGIGEIVCHRFYSFRGVVFDIDPVFANTEDWWRSIPQELRPRKDQPFYHLLAENDETEYIAYVSEQNLVRDKTGAPLRHPQVPEMFVEDDEGRLLPVFRQEH